MQSVSWAPEQSEALRKYVAAGMSFSEAARALNAEFGTAFTRNAIIGRAKRMKIAVPGRPGGSRQPKLPKPKQAIAAAVATDGSRATLAPATPPTQRAEPVKLRCVGIRPRLVPFDELGTNDCRYPYGGDKEGEAIAFCGHPRFQGSSYCAPHFHLTRGPRPEADRPTGPFVLRLVEAA
jgi:GcrA cell cycle regulator